MFGERSLLHSVIVVAVPLAAPGNPISVDGRCESMNPNS